MGASVAAAGRDCASNVGAWLPCPLEPWLPWPFEPWLPCPWLPCELELWLDCGAVARGLAREVVATDVGWEIETAGVEGLSTNGVSATGVSDGAGIVLCPKVFVDAVAAGGGEEDPEEEEALPKKLEGEVAVLVGGIGVALPEAGLVAGLDPADGPGAAPAPGTAPDPGGVVPPPPGPGDEDGGSAVWRWVGWFVPGRRINDAATTPAAAAAATPTTGRRR